jgi:adenosine deaminase
MESKLKNFINNIPKCELHLHIEGSFEPELMFEIAKRNNITIPYNSAEEVKAAYKFKNLQEFLDIYYAGASVLICEQDFYDLTWAYIQKIHEQNVIHTEIMFDPQTHTDREISFDTVINGIHNALVDAEKKYGITSKLIMSFLRHLDEDSAIETFNWALPHKEKITAVGLDSSEVGNPPEKFQHVFALARNAGLLTVAHAGEEGPPEYVHTALDVLKVSRIDHGNRALEDEALVQELVKKKMPLTVCPLSNDKLQVVSNLTEHPLKEMLKKDLMATVNSDDPAYFGGYVNENFIAITEALNLSIEDIHQLVVNAFSGSFLDQKTKTTYLKRVDDFYETNK